MDQRRRSGANVGPERRKSSKGRKSGTKFAGLMRLGSMADDAPLNMKTIMAGLKGPIHEDEEHVEIKSAPAPSKQTTREDHMFRHSHHAYSKIRTDDERIKAIIAESRTPAPSVEKVK